MPFGLKNVPSKFQRIVNDMFNSYSKFCIVYIDDIHVFSNSLEQYFKHLQTFFYLAKKNGLVVLKSKIYLFLTHIRFLSHYIFQGTIIPIKRLLTFASKFPNKILDKTSCTDF
jgi:cyclopropane fatty-acyl-phospholipid synthase-like methyltransferase